MSSQRRATAADLNREEPAQARDLVRLAMKSPGKTAQMSSTGGSNPDATYKCGSPDTGLNRSRDEGTGSVKACSRGSHRTRGSGNG